MNNEERSAIAYQLEDAERAVEAAQKEHQRLLLEQRRFQLIDGSS